MLFRQKSRCTTAQKQEVIETLEVGEKSGFVEDFNPKEYFERIASPTRTLKILHQRMDIRKRLK